VGCSAPLVPPFETARVRKGPRTARTCPTDEATIAQAWHAAAIGGPAGSAAAIAPGAL